MTPPVTKDRSSEHHGQKWRFGMTGGFWPCIVLAAWSLAARERLRCASDQAEGRELSDNNRKVTPDLAHW